MSLELHGCEHWHITPLGVHRAWSRAGAQEGFLIPGQLSPELESAQSPSSWPPASSTGKEGGESQVVVACRRAQAGGWADLHPSWRPWLLGDLGHSLGLTFLLCTLRC